MHAKRGGTYEAAIAVAIQRFSEAEENGEKIRILHELEALVNNQLMEYLPGEMRKIVRLRELKGHIKTYLDELAPTKH